MLRMMVHSSTLGLEDEARGAHPESFEMLSKAKTEFAHPTPVPGTEGWIDELRLLTKRSQCFFFRENQNRTREKV